MKKYFLLFLLFSFALHSKAQQDPQFSQYIFNNLSFNPGSAGSEEAICVTALHRSQWVGFEDAPVSTNFAVQSPLSLLHGGIGLNILTWIFSRVVVVHYSINTFKNIVRIGFGEVIAIFTIS